MPSWKPLEFRGSSYRDLLSFPREAIHDAGFQLDKVQNGEEPDDWKPLPGVGRGAGEIRIWASDGTYRIVYVARFEAAIFVLHCFQKKTQRTSAHDIEVAAQRYRQLVREIKDGQ